MVKPKSKDDRHKTDMRIPRELFATIESTSRDVLGVPINAFLSMAAAHYVAVVTEAAPGKKRRDILNTLEREFQKIVDRARGAA